MRHLKAEQNFNGEFMKNCIIKMYCILSFAILMILVFTACGKKGPPVPPGIPNLPAVSGFSHVIDGDFVRLVWNKPEIASSTLKGYVVHRSKTSVGSDNCDGCPISFQRVAEISAGSENFDELIEKGYDYIYKVVAVSIYDSTSPDSKLIKFRYDASDEKDIMKEK